MGREDLRDKREPERGKGNELLKLRPPIGLDVDEALLPKEGQARARSLVDSVIAQARKNLGAPAGDPTPVERLAVAQFLQENGRLPNPNNAAEVRNLQARIRLFTTTALESEGTPAKVNALATTEYARLLSDLDKPAEVVAKDLLDVVGVRAKDSDARHKTTAFTKKDDRTPLPWEVKRAEAEKLVEKLSEDKKTITAYDAMLDPEKIRAPLLLRLRDSKLITQADYDRMVERANPPLRKEERDAIEGHAKAHKAIADVRAFPKAFDTARTAAFNEIARFESIVETLAKAGQLPANATRTEVLEAALKARDPKTDQPLFSEFRRLSIARDLLGKDASADDVNAKAGVRATPSPRDPKSDVRPLDDRKPAPKDTPLDLNAKTVPAFGGYKNVPLPNGMTLKEITSFYTTFAGSTVNPSLGNYDAFRTRTIVTRFDSRSSPPDRVVADLGSDLRSKAFDHDVLFRRTYAPDVQKLAAEHTKALEEVEKRWKEIIRNPSPELGQTRARDETPAAYSDRMHKLLIAMRAEKIDEHTAKQRETLLPFYRRVSTDLRGMGIAVTPEQLLDQAVPKRR